MDTSLSLVLASTILFVLGLATTRWIHSHYQMPVVVSPDDRPSPTPLISVIVPARNEARNIRRCVEALLAQTYTPAEIVVVDDRSTDATAQILAEIVSSDRRASGGRLRVIHGVEPPPGWAGKPHALSLGVQQARGDWLCFIDADTFAEPSLLDAALATAQRQQADMFSILTDQILVTFWEKTIQPLVFTGLSVGFPAERVNDPARPEAIANGQFILIRREVYEAVGGHAAVANEIAEDKALAELVKGKGYRLVLADGRAVANTRMYTNLAEIWEGWTKNIYLGMRDRLGLLAVGALSGLMGALVPLLWPAGAAIWLALEPGWAPAVALAEAGLLWAYLLYFRAQAARAFHISPLYAFTLPLGSLLFTGMMFTSAFNVLSGRGVRWKGRQYR